MSSETSSTAHTLSASKLELLSSEVASRIVSDEDNPMLLHKKSAKKQEDIWWSNFLERSDSSCNPFMPYVRMRDLSDPFSRRKNDITDDSSGRAIGAEIGFKFKF